MKNGLFDIGIASFVFTPLAVTVTLLLCILWNRVREGRARLRAMDTPGLLLAAVVSRMSEERHEWGAAMTTELSRVRGSYSRWRFALGCARVALFPPRRGGLLQTIMNHKIKSIITTLGSAALISFFLALPFALLEFRFHTVNSRNALDYIVLFGLLWLLPTAFIVVLMPMARALRAGNSILANPVTLLIRVSVLAFIAIMWGGLLIDQLPCFLGVPNCD